MANISAIPIEHLNTADLLDEIGAKHVKFDDSGGLLNEFLSGPEDCVIRRKLLLTKELWKRVLLEKLVSRPIFSQPEDVKNFLQLHFFNRQYESFVVLFLNSQHQLISCDEMFRGTLTQTSVYPREIVKSALKKNAASLVFAHNHPSGAVSPSRADESLTQTLKSALALVDVRVLDHFIVAPPAITSMAEMGLI